MNYFEKEDIIDYTKECCKNCYKFPKELYKNKEFIGYVSEKINESYEADRKTLEPDETMEDLEESCEFLSWPERYENAVNDMDDATKRHFGFTD